MKRFLKLRILLGIVLLAAAGGLVWLLIKRTKKFAPAAPAEAPAE